VSAQVLKTHTKEVLYEKYRTEKLLARRATRNISDDERQRLLEGTLILPLIELFLMLTLPQI
jgi:septin family protein